jgi:Mrp family chromosome partitioning ATPase
VSEQLRSAVSDNEPDLLRDQFRQLLKYRGMIGTGALLGLLGGAWFGLTGQASYVATSEVRIRSATVDPFTSGSSSADKQIDIGSERQTASSNSVAIRAAKALGRSGDAADVSELQNHLQVTNPTNTLVLRFAYTASTPKSAAHGATAFSQAYLDSRQDQTKSLIKNMIAGYKKQLDPMAKDQAQLLEQIKTIQDDTAKSTVLASQASLLGQISQLKTSIGQLEALDTTPGYVIKTATPPTAPQGLGLPVLLALGTVVGLALGLLLAWIRLVFDPAARSDGEVARALQAPVLGTLPRVRPGPLLAADHADVRLAEEYRSVAFRLAYDKRFADRRRLLVVAPRGTGEAAASAAVNLSASFAETGIEALLIEADLRSPGLSARLRVADGTRPGWARSAELGEGGWPAGLQVAIDAGESGIFDLVPGRRVRNVARSLTSPAVTRLIAEADAPNSTVIVLAPPVLAYADALALVDRVDGVVVVCDPRAVHRADLDRIRELISGAGGSVLGAVLHHTPRRRLFRRGSASASATRRHAGGEHPVPPPAGRSGPHGGGGSAEAAESPETTLTLHTIRSGSSR